MCKCAVKTILHDLVGCDKLQQIWELRGNNRDLMGAPSSNFKEWLEWLTTKFQMEEVTELLIVCCAACAVWNGRVFKGKDQNLPTVVQWFKKMVVDYMEYNSEVHETSYAKQAESWENGTLHLKDM